MENGNFFTNTEFNQKPHRDFGIWTYGQSLNDDNINEPEYVSNKTLKKLAEADVYFIYGLTENKLESKLVKNLNRCKEYGIEVHLSINPIKYAYTNIWTFESFKDEVEEVLDYLQDHDFLNNTITTLVYDMEAPPKNAFPHYGLNIKNVNKLNEYYEVQEEFQKFNNYIQKEYDLKIRITTDFSQGLDLKDNDIDLSTFSGLMFDDEADMAYMIYRRNTFGRNQLLDAFRVLNDGDIIILNAWRDIGSLCWKNLKCALKDVQLVLGYSEKSFRLEIWDLANFIYSYGEKGLIDLVEAIQKDTSEWSKIEVWNIFPYNFYWDTIFFGMICLDMFGPTLRIVFRIF
ncbi:MAG: hypothetical protein ACFFAO_05055 [Candidatus Hermodarchaeota archaeon]